MVEWKDGTKVSDAYVDENGKIVPAEYEGNTPLSAHNLNKMQELIDTYRSNYITAKTIEGAGKIKKIFGSLTQETRSGKNLIEIADGDYTNNGITAVVKDGIITLNGTATDTSFVVVNLKKEYVSKANTYHVLKANIEETIGDSSNYSALRLNDDGTKQVTFNNINSYYVQMNTADLTVTKIVIRTAKNLKYSNFVVKPQFELGQTATEWEQGGIAPSPDYPAEIEVVENEISYKTRNKNSFNIDAFQSQIQNLHTNYANVAKKDNGFSITSTDSDCYFNKGNTNNDVLMEIVPGVKNYLSYDSTGSNTIAKYVNYYDKNYSIISSNNWIGTSNKVNFTPPSNAKYVFIRFGLAYQVGITATITNIMLCTEDIEYIAHQSETTTLKLPQNEFLAKINDYQDYIDENGTIHKKIGKIVLDGTENFEKATSGDFYAYVCNNIINTSETIGKCTHFETFDGTEWRNMSDCQVFVGRNNNQLVVKYDKFTTVDELKTWLAEQYENDTPVEVYYVLAEEYTTSCDFSNIIAQYADETNLSCNTEVEAEFTQSDGIATVLKSMGIIQKKILEQEAE